jgi:cytoskeleton protein RodZ
LTVDEYQNEADADRAVEHIGTVMRQRRTEQGRELADIAHQTRIPLRHLTAIEDGRHDSLPAMPYTIGFVKSYARALGIDAEAAAEQFRSETTKSDRIVPTIVHEPIEDARVPPRRAAALGIALFAVLALVIAAYGAGLFGGDEAPEAVVADSNIGGSDSGTPVAADPAPAGVAAPGAVASAPDTPVASPAAAAPGTIPAVAGGPIVIAAREDAWVKVYDRATGQSVFMGVMAAGDRYEVPADRQDLLLQTGRAGVLDITVGAAAIPPLGAPTAFVKDVPLTAAGLAGRTAPAAAAAVPPGSAQ